jgi:hypothetical protein
MGLNVSLVEMLGVSNHSTCPKCGDSYKNNYHDYDIETDCFKSKKKSTEWTLLNYCPFCDHEFKDKFTISISNLHQESHI